jgi:CBS domain-containing protein
MKVRDVMTHQVYTVRPATTIAELAQLLASQRISGAPVTEPEDRVIGIVTEGDLMRRHEIGTDKTRRSWVQRIFETPADLAYGFVRTHAVYVREIMTRGVISVGEADSLADVADTFEKRNIKRAPVLRDGKLVGIISRGDLVRALAQRLSQKAEAPSDDQAVARRFRQTLEQEPWAEVTLVNFDVKDGVVHMWGMADTEEQRQALRVAAESIPGVKRVEDHLLVRPPYVAAE